MQQQNARIDWIKLESVLTPSTASDDTDLVCLRHAGSSLNSGRAY